MFTQCNDFNTLKRDDLKLKITPFVEVKRLEMHWNYPSYI